MVRAAKAPKPVEPIRHDDTAPAAAQAAQIALLVMKRVRCQTWKAVIDLAAETDIRTKVFLSTTQQALLDQYADILPYLSTSPLVTVVACPACGRFGLQDRRSPGAKCIFTTRCEGKLVKASSTPKPKPKVVSVEDAAAGEGPASDDRLVS